MQRIKIQLLFLALLAVSCKTEESAPASGDRLEDSPRHHEWVSVSHGGRNVESYLVYPEASDPTLSVVVIHENRGLTDWVRTVADRLAEEGYIAIAPDLLTGSGPGGGRTSDFPDSDAAREAIYNLDPDQVTADLAAVAAYVGSLPAARGDVVVGGFCWGGSQTFRFATNDTTAKAYFVFYGTGPEDGHDRITAPVYGFYGDNDERVNATIPSTQQAMLAAGKVYQPEIYADAGHGFMRSGEAPDASAGNADARDQGWERWLGLLASI